MMVAQWFCHVVRCYDGSSVVVWQLSGCVMLYIVIMVAQWLCHVVHYVDSRVVMLYIVMLAAEWLCCTLL